MSANEFKVGDVVKCVDAGVSINLTVGEEYLLVGVRDTKMVKVKNDKGCYYYYDHHRFELSDDSANTQQTPKFKEGDMVYLIGSECLKLCKLQERRNNNSPMKFKVEVAKDVFETFTEDGKYFTGDATPRIVLATEESRKMLNKLLGVEYEPVKLTGSDLAKKLLKNKPQTCYVSDTSDNIALSNKCIDLIAKFENGGFIAMDGTGWKFAVPCNQHGEVLEDE